MMPAVGFGVYQIAPEATERAVGDALEVGYRMIDTAASYFNEEQVGNAIRSSGLKREELFVTTKLWVQDYEYDDALRAFDRSMKALGLDYLDLFLLHKPYGTYYAAWRAVEKVYEEGRIRALGIQRFPRKRGHPARGMGAVRRGAKRHLQQPGTENHCGKTRQDGGGRYPPLVEPAGHSGHSEKRSQGTHGGKPEYFRFHADRTGNAGYRRTRHGKESHLRRHGFGHDTIYRNTPDTRMRCKFRQSNRLQNPLSRTSNQGITIRNIVYKQYETGLYICRNI